MVSCCAVLCALSVDDDVRSFGTSPSISSLELEPAALKSPHCVLHVVNKHYILSKALDHDSNNQSNSFLGRQNHSFFIMDYSLDELKSRLKMSEIEVKITTSASNGLKKSRKSKTPVFRQQRRPSSGGEENNSITGGSPKGTDQRASLSPESPIVSEAKSLLINEPPLPPPPGGIKSYSDFMRSLAAKYNNNENGFPTSTESPFQPFKASSAPAPTPALPPPPPTSAVATHPLLGLPSPFPFFSSLADPKSKGHLAPALPPGFPAFDIHSTQALLNLARSSNFLNAAGTVAPSVSTSSSSSVTPSFNNLSSETKKRPVAVAVSEALDLSPPTNSNIVSKKMRLDATKVDPSILNWSVSEVCNFVASIDICKEYTEVFREHNIDGSALPLLTEDHLTLRLGLKLGPALKLRSIIAKKLGPAHAEICVHCAHCNAKMSENADNNVEDQQQRSASRSSNLSEK